MQRYRALREQKLNRKNNISDTWIREVEPNYETNMQTTRAEKKTSQNHSKTLLFMCL
jgi:hypothetical protein